MSAAAEWVVDFVVLVLFAGGVGWMARRLLKGFIDHLDAVEARMAERDKTHGAVHERLNTMEATVNEIAVQLRPNGGSSALDLLRRNADDLRRLKFSFEFATGMDRLRSNIPPGVAFARPVAEWRGDGRGRNQRGGQNKTYLELFGDPGEQTNWHQFVDTDKSPRYISEFESALKGRDTVFQRSVVYLFLRGDRTRSVSCSVVCYIQRGERGEVIEQGGYIWENEVASQLAFGR